MKHLCKNCKHCSKILKEFGCRTTYCNKTSMLGITQKVVHCKDFADKNSRETTITITFGYGEK